MTNHIVIERLTYLAGALIPGAEVVPDLTVWLDRALRACGYTAEDLAEALNALPDEVDFGGAQSLAAMRPDAFAILSTIVSAAYVMSPTALRAFGFPEDRRNPAGIEDFLAEFETGIFEPMMAREPMFRDPRKRGTT